MEEGETVSKAKEWKGIGKSSAVQNPLEREGGKNRDEHLLPFVGWDVWACARRGQS